MMIYLTDLLSITSCATLRTKFCRIPPSSKIHCLRRTKQMTRFNKNGGILTLWFRLKARKRSRENPYTMGGDVGGCSCCFSMSFTLLEDGEEEEEEDDDDDERCQCSITTKVNHCFILRSGKINLKYGTFG